MSEKTAADKRDLVTVRRHLPASNPTRRINLLHSAARSTFADCYSAYTALRIYSLCRSDLQGKKFEYVLVQVFRTDSC